MNKIEKMIQEMCPDGVEWKKLGEVCLDKFWIMPTTPNFIDNGIPYITGKNIKNGIIDFDNIKYISEIDYNLMTQNRNIKIGDILISMIGTIGEIGIVKNDRKFYGQNLYLLRLNNFMILNEYFYYYFTQSHIKNSLVSKKNSSSQGYIRAGQLENIEIPIPPLKIQEEIVKILDIFEKYATKLQAKLQQRYKQYNYYRDMMLSEEYLNKLSEKLECSARITYVLLEEVVKIKNGKDWKGLEKGEVPVYGSGGEMNEYVNKSSYNKPTVLIPRKGSLNNVYYLDIPFWNVDTIFYTEIDEKRLHPKYFYYFMENYDLYKLSNESTRPSVTQSSLNKLLIPLAPLYIQKQIVKVLDKFQDYINETKGLLPKEIEQRKKQYEYYREKLLTFGDEISTMRQQTADSRQQTADSRQ